LLKSDSWLICELIGRGRYIVTERDLKAGEVILITKPYTLGNIFRLKFYFGRKKYYSHLYALIISYNTYNNICAIIKISNRIGMSFD
jgi:ribosome biogenesis protein Nip4